MGKEEDFGDGFIYGSDLWVFYFLYMYFWGVGEI